MPAAQQGVEFVQTLVGADLVEPFLHFVAGELTAGDECLLHRREIEKLHQRLEGDAAKAAVTRAMEALHSKDAGIRSPARIALEHQDPALWRAAAITEKDPQAAILAAVALCRAGAPSTDGTAVATRLAALESSVRGTPLEKEWLRACELWMLRFASRATDVGGGDALRDAVLAHFPAADGIADASELDMHRAAFLAKIGSPKAVEVAVDLLSRPDVRSAPQIDAALLARGGPYGKAVADIIANAPATQKIGLVHAVRDAKNGWTADNRMRLVSVHPGVSVEQVIDSTTFELVIDGDVPTTREPTDEELKLIREVIDPKGTRKAEFK